MDKVIELKAKAYDLIGMIQEAQRELNNVNQEILRLITEQEKK